MFSVFMLSQAKTFPLHVRLGKGILSILVLSYAKYPPKKTRNSFPNCILPFKHQSIMSINNTLIAQGNINKPFFAYIALHFAIINMADIKYMAYKLVKYRCETDDDQVNVLLLWLKGIKKKKKKKAKHFTTI